MPELPEELRRHFQEYDGRRLSWEENRPTIVGRLLEAGGWDAVQWLRSHLGEEELTAGWTLNRMLSLYREKYETRDIGHVLYSLVYFDDAEPEEMPEMLSDVGREDVERTLEGWVRAYERDVRPNNPGD